MTRVTVIGAQGYIGSRLTARLKAAGREVYAPQRGDAQLFQQDLGRVFYCAGLTGDFDARPFDTVEAHVGLLTDVLRAKRFEQIIYLSSTRVYDSLGAAGGREDDRLMFDPTAARNVYDLSKALGENLVLARSSGRGAVARLSNVVDPEDEAGGFLSNLVSRARVQRDIALDSSPDAVRDYVHVEDVLAALEALEVNDARGIYNVAAGRNVSNADLAKLMAEAGWTLSLTGPRSTPDAPRIDVRRLRGLGVEPRDVCDVLRAALARPGFFRG